MQYSIFSPLAIVCALTTLYSAPAEPSDGSIADLYDEFETEEMPFESLTTEWSVPEESKEELATIEAPAQSPLPQNEEALAHSTSPEAPKEELATIETPAQNALHQPQNAVEVAKTSPSVLFYDPDTGNFYKKTQKIEPYSMSAAAQPLNNPLLLADNSPINTAMAPTEENNSFLSLGGTYAYTHLKPHGNSSFHGNLGGIQGLYEYRPCNRIYGALKASWRQGETHASDATRFLVDVTAEERLGYTMTMDEDQWLWTFFTGLGYHFLGHHLRESGESLRFNYNEFYVPVGIFTDYQIYPCFSMGIHATWMPQIFPTVSISPLGGARWATSYQLGNVLIEAPLTYFAGKHHQFFITFTPTFQYWKDGHTTAKTSTGEALGVPGNTYFFWGADLNLGYAF